MPEPAPASHRVAYPLVVNGVVRATCRCHWWQPVARRPRKAAA